MAAERGYYEITPEPSRNSDGTVLFRGSGDATLTVFGFENWKEFLSRGDRPLTEAEVERIEEAASVENFSVGGRIAVEWPDVELAFAMDDFVGEYVSLARKAATSPAPFLRHPPPPALHANLGEDT